MVKSIINKDNNSNNNTASDTLNNCLADTEWLQNMFSKFKKLLCDLDLFINEFQNKSNTTNNNEIENNNSNNNLIKNSLFLTLS